MFKRKKAVPNPATDKMAGYIVRKAMVMQQRWAAFMQHKTERLSLKAKKFCLAGLCIVTGSYCFYLIAESFTEHTTKDTVMVTRIHFPRHITGESKPPPVSEKDYLKIEGYKKYMDSCGLTIPRGLADSIKQFEKMYQSSKK